MAIDYSSFGTVKEAENIYASDRLKLAIVGPPKSGKSHLAATSEQDIFFWDFDDRSESLSGKKGVVVKTLVDKRQDNPTAYGALEADIGMFEYMKSQGKEIPKTFVLDSMTFLRKYAESYYFKTNPSGLKSFKVGTDNVLVARGFDPHVVVRQMLENLMWRLFALGHTIAIFHEGAEKAPDSTEDDPKYTGRITVNPQGLRTLLPMFNECWRINVNSGNKFEVQTRPDYQFMGSTCLFVNDREEPNISSMLQKHRAKMAPAK